MIMIALIRSFKLAFFMMRLTIIGFGNQAKAWSQNLQDSGFPFRVALMPHSPSFEKVLSLKMESVEIGTKDFFEDQAYALLTPDHTHDDFLKKFGHQFKKETLILYNHGFSISQHRFQETYPDINHVLFAIKAIGSEVRKQYLESGKIGAVYSLEHLKHPTHQIDKWIQILSVALGINLGLYRTTFEHETQADLYSEQGLLCSLIPYAAGEMFEHLVENGIEPELAYLECWHELKLIVNAMVDIGPEKFYDLISPNALIGSEKGFQRLFTPEFKANLKSLLVEIQNNTFNREISEAKVDDLRQIIRQRWNRSPLMNTFNKINLKS
jgi:ketol-acid reductoisomerase